MELYYSFNMIEFPIMKLVIVLDTIENREQRGPSDSFVMVAN